MFLESSLKKHGKIYFLTAFVVFIAVYGLVFFRLHELSHKSWNSFVLVGDSIEELIPLADNLKNYGIFSQSESPPFIPESFRTPGYPLFIAAVKLFFKNYFAISVIQAFLVFLSGYLIFKIGQKVLSTTAGFFAFLLYIFSANVILHSLYVLSDNLYAFFSILSVYLLFFRDDDLGKARNIILAGLALGVTIFIKPVGALLPLIFGFFLFVFLIKKQKFRKVLFSVLLLELAVFAVILPWGIRNKIVTGSSWKIFSVSNSWGMTSTGTFNLYYFYIPQYLCLKQDPRSCYDEKNMADIKASLRRAIGYNDENLDLLSSIKYSSAMAEESLRIINGDRLGFASYYLKATLPRFFLSSSFKRLAMDLSGDSDNTKNNTLRDFAFRGEFSSMWQKIKAQPVYTLGIIWSFLITILCVLSLFKIRSNGFILMFLLIIAHYVFITGPAAYFRYRLPADPFIIIAALAGLLFLTGFSHRNSGAWAKNSIT